MLLRICVTCDRNRPDAPSAGEELAADLAQRLDARRDLACSVLRVACLSGCKHPCQALLTGGRPLQIGGLNRSDASFLLDAAAHYASGGEASDLAPPSSFVTISPSGAALSFSRIN